MTDRAQFEAMLNALINEDQDAAKEIFHNIVVAKSREIYEELLAEDFDLHEGQDSGNPYAGKEEEEEEGSEEEGSEEEGSEEEEGSDNPFGGEDDGEEEDGEEEGEDDGEEEGDDEFGGDDFGGEEEGDDGAIEDRVMDLEDALEDLKAEFEHLLAGEEHEEETGVAGDHGGELDGLGGDEMGAGGEEEDEFAGLMEYTLKVAPAKMGDNGVNTKSSVAGKNDMGGTTANIAKNFSTTTGGTAGGLLKPTTQPQDGGNINVPGGKAGKTAFKKQEPGHGAEKKGKGETADNKNSMLNGAPKRAK